MRRRTVGRIEILTPDQYVTGGGETEELRSTIESLSEGGNKWLIINMIDNLHINSKGLGVLIRAHSNYVRRGGQMKLCSVSKRLENIFVITKLALVFDVYKNEQQALESFNVQAAG